MFVTKSKEVTAGWGEMHNEGISNLYSSLYYQGDKIEANVMGKECSTREKDEKKFG